MKCLVVANWKMNPATWREARQLFEAIKKAADRSAHLSVVVAAPSLYVRSLRERYHGRRLAFAIQHARAETQGAHTGDVSLIQSKDAGVQYAIVGHAERRAQGETDDETGAQVGEALSLKVTPILCVGEAERTSDAMYFEVVRRQLRAGFAQVDPSHLQRVIVAYEPVWAIGKQSAMRPRDMHEMAIFIRKTLVDLSMRNGPLPTNKKEPTATAMGVRILYGGSIDEQNAPAMLTEGDIQGFLVGRASQESARMRALLQALDAVA